MDRQPGTMQRSAEDAPAGGSYGPLRLRRRAGRQGAETPTRLLNAALDELRESGFEGLTVRAAARRAGLASTTAYTYFSSKEHLVAELFWRLVVSTPPGEVDPAAGTARQAADALAPIAAAVATEPELARACTLSLLTDSPDVRRLRDQIAGEWVRRVTASVSAGATPQQVSVLLLSWTGLLLSAGIGHITYGDIPSHLGMAADVIIGTDK